MGFLKEKGPKERTTNPELITTTRESCKVPVEIELLKKMNESPILRVWMGHGSGRVTTCQELFSYIKLTREWADVMEKIAKEIS